MNTHIIEPNKRRSVVSYANLSPELLTIIKEKYPRGYADYMDEILKISKPDGTFFHAIKIETTDAIYLVKVDVKIDDYAEVEKDIFGDHSVSAGGEDDDGFPDSDDGSGGFADEDGEPVDGDSDNDD
ncbi:MAG: hypothetical protein FWD56_01680 [Bacteroidales bacterium]|nr:hypothetical protein [Bacteroidales bacterium]